MIGTQVLAKTYVTHSLAVLSLCSLRRLALELLLPLASLGLRFGTHDAASPCHSGSIIEAALGCLHNLGQFSLVFRLDGSQGQSSGVFLVHHSA